MLQKTIADLVEDARRGSQEARDELVRRHQRETSLLAAAIVNDPTEGDDLSQEAFIRAFRNLDLLIDPSRFSPWLRKIVVGVSIDWLRSFRADLYRGWDGVDDLSRPSGAPSPLEQLLQSELVTRVRAALEALPARYRVPIRLYHLDGLSHQKIADALGVPVATVRSLVARARRKLAPGLAEYGPQDAEQIQETLAERTARRAAPRRLHVANGTCTTTTIEAAGIPGATAIWADPLHDGPVPGGLDDDALVDVRRRHLAPFPGAADPANDLRVWRQTIAGHASYDELVLWFEHDLFDQLNLIQILSWIHGRLPANKIVSLICIGSFPGHPNFRGLGQLTPDEMASLFETRQSVGEAQYELAARAWHAFRDATPETMADLLTMDTSALPYLGPALWRFLEEYPAIADGLSRTERTLLQLAARGPIDLADAFRCMHEGEHAFYITDTGLDDLVRVLSTTSPPLLTAFNGSIALTESGQAVLGGRTDRVAACGIDRWYGGVHLHGRSVRWRWNSSAGGIVVSLLD